MEGWFFKGGHTFLLVWFWPPPPGSYTHTLFLTDRGLGEGLGFQTAERVWMRKAEGHNNMIVQLLRSRINILMIIHLLELVL